MRNTGMRVLRWAPAVIALLAAGRLMALEAQLKTLSSRQLELAPAAREAVPTIRSAALDDKTVFSYQWIEPNLAPPLLQLESTQRDFQRGPSLQLQQDATEWMKWRVKTEWLYNSPNHYEFGEWMHDEKQDYLTRRLRLENQFQPLHSVTVSPFFGMEQTDHLSRDMGRLHDQQDQNLGVRGRWQLASPTSLSVETSRREHLRKTEVTTASGVDAMSATVNQRFFRPVDGFLSVREEDQSPDWSEARASALARDYGLNLHPFASTALKLGCSDQEVATARFGAPVSENTAASYYAEIAQRLSSHWSLQGEARYRNTESRQALDGSWTDLPSASEWTMNFSQSVNISDGLSFRMGYRVNVPESNSQLAPQLPVQQRVSMGLHLDF